MTTRSDRRGSSAGRAEGAGWSFVLPRFLRKPVRLLGRLFAGDVKVPRHAETVVFGGLFAATALYGSILGGQFSSAVESVTVATGFAVSEIEIEGNVYSRPEDVFAVLGLDGRRSLVSIDPAESRRALGELPWIQNAEIRKVYPGKLIISVAEKTPYAIWQTGDALSVVEEDGTVIGGYTGETLAHLPLLVGAGAAEAGADFVKLASEFPDIAERTRAYVRIGARRWNLRMDNGVTVKLPEDNVVQALGRLIALQAQLGVLERDVAAIDLRLEDRTVFALTENARTAREASFKERGIKIEKPGGSI